MEEEIKVAERWLGELLAAIHGDGGHYQDEWGTEQASKDALKKFYRLKQENDELREKRKEDEIMSKEKSTQKSGEGFSNSKIYGPKGGNPTNGGGINRPTKGQG